MAPRAGFERDTSPGHDLWIRLTNADIAFMFEDGDLNIIKNRYGFHGEGIPVEAAVTFFSSILAQMSFKDNDLKMFREGLFKQIEEAIRIAIHKFHEGR